MSTGKELFLFEGAQPFGDFYPMDENEHNVIGEGDASDSKSDIESNESSGSPTEEIRQMCGLQRQKRSLAVWRVMNVFLSC